MIRILESMKLRRLFVALSIAAVMLGINSGKLLADHPECAGPLPQESGDCGRWILECGSSDSSAQFYAGMIANTQRTQG
jgi:hypothetical protein